MSEWLRSTKSQHNGGCVEIRKMDGTIAMRDSKDPSGPVLRFTPAEWDCFLDGAHKGEFDNI